ncbi:hypothetical protein QM012_006984 [Aureobasidium pullulans]|uniref:Shugoshin C-terminal domain-containing protein n=1 Tax=Aureobasidium pullulans TaxID=5580 RepID=A0ABR0TQ70_AURPU
MEARVGVAHSDGLQTNSGVSAWRRPAWAGAWASRLAHTKFHLYTIRHTTFAIQLVARHMARLNEAPLPTESVDALKRRFVRQNRELAKNNSAQCLRIRALECEVSRLLAENLDLREDIVHLRAQLSEPRSHIDNSALDSVKDQLQAKLLEFGALVSELGQIQTTHPSLPQDKSYDTSSWRPEVPAAILSGQAPRMDGIAEETSSPGGSLRSSHTNPTRLSNHSNPSPDIGPPPIAHFDNEDPIEFDPHSAEIDQPTYDEQEEHLTSDHESLPDLSVNLETRRKRKDSKVQLRRSSLLPSNTDDDEQPHLTRTSAKRKLSMRDVEDEVEKRVMKDDFKFSRRSSLAPDFTNTETLIIATDNLEDTETPALLPERKVLGNKSVNVSPRKLSRSTKGKGDVKKEDAPLKPAVKATDRRKSKNPLAKSVTIATSEPETIMRTIEIALPSELPEEEMEDLAPKTPLPEFFSPTPSEPSTARDEGRDTPPPSGLKSMSSGPAALNGASRPSRRARAAVNYAEPNLVSKMRRPTAAKADAVDLNGRRISSNVTTSEKKTMRTVIIKGDDMQGSLTRDMGSEAPSPLGQKVYREHERTLEANKEPSASGRAMSALMAGSKKQERTVGEDAGVYELKDSSDVEEKAASRKKNSRRHSSMTDGSERSSNGAEVQVEAEEKQEEAEVRKAPRSARVDRSGARRRSMMV